MEDFAQYILSEEDLASKMEIVYYLSKKTGIFFDKSVVFKTEILRLFLNYSKIDVDKNLLLTTCLLCTCKKGNNIKNLEEIHSYAKNSANYLRELGFSKRFAKICEEVNRYSNSNPRERESDILELVDQFSGMLLDRPERIGFKPDEALVLLEHRNLKNVYNRYLGTFIDFVNFIQNIKINNKTNVTILEELTKKCNESENIKQFIQEVMYDYETKVDKLMAKYTNSMAEGMFCHIDPNRSLFSEGTARKIMNNIIKENMEETDTVSNNN